MSWKYLPTKARSKSSPSAFSSSNLRMKSAFISESFSDLTCFALADIAISCILSDENFFNSSKRFSSFSSWLYSLFTVEPTASASSIWAVQCFLISSCPNFIASSISSSEISFMSPSTISMLSKVAASIISMSASSNCEKVGFIISSPPILATRTSEIGPLKGISLTASAADAANPANESGISSLFLSAEISSTFTNVSAWKSAGKSGRNALSISLATSTSSSDGLASLFLKPPGKRPAAANFSL